MVRQRIASIDRSYAGISRGMSTDEVRAVVGERFGTRMYLRGVAYWDELRLGPDEDARIHDAWEARVETPFLPITWEITFDEHGRVVGRHRYD